MEPRRATIHAVSKGVSVHREQERAFFTGDRVQLTASVSEMKLAHRDALTVPMVPFCGTQGKHKSFSRREASVFLTYQFCSAYFGARKENRTPRGKHRALFSLIFWKVLREGKLTSNPASPVRQQQEDNGRIRFLTDLAETKFRVIGADGFPEHDGELTISLGMGMRPSGQDGLIWNDADFVRREIYLAKAKNGPFRTIPMNGSVIKAMESLRSKANRTVSAPRDSSRGTT